MAKSFDEELKKMQDRKNNQDSVPLNTTGDGAKKPMSVDEFIKANKKTSKTKAAPAKSKKSEKKGVLPFLSRTSDKFLKGAADVAVGAAKGVMDVPREVSKLGKFIGKEVGKKIPIGKALRPVVQAVLPQSTRKDLHTATNAVRGISDTGVKQTTLTKPTNTAQKIGYGAEKVAELLVPGLGEARGAQIGMKVAEKLPLVSRIVPKVAEIYGAESKATKLIQQVIEGAPKLLGRAGVSAAGGGAVEAVQSGKIDGETLTAALINGLIPIGGEAISAGARTVLGGTAKTIENSLVKPIKADLEDGFKSENIFKYNLGGTLRQTAEKTQKLIEDEAAKLKSIVKASGEKVNLSEIADAVEKEILDSKSKTFWENPAMKSALAHMRSAIDQGPGKNGIVDLAEALDVKRSVGRAGAWVYGMADPESTARQAVANKLYNKLKVALEEKGGPEIKAINKKLSELIPIEHAIIRRIPVAQRGNVISLTNLLTMIPALANPKLASLFFLNMLSKSGAVANVLDKASRVTPMQAGSVLRGTTGPEIPR